MRAGWVAVAAVFFGLPDRVAAQELLPNGLEVSRPLTPVLAPDEPPPAAEPEPVARVEEIQKQKYRRRGPLGPAWDSFEFLMWWPRAHPLPPLVTGTRAGAPVPGDPNTVLLVGGRSIGNADIAGGRFTLGSSLNEDETVGTELVYFFLGSRTHRATFAGTPRLPSLGLPYLNALSGREDVFAVGSPGWVSAATATRVQGAEANAVANLIEGKALRINGLLGYRFLQVQEGLSVTTLRQADLVTTYDEFSTSNRFHGGQLGLHADIGQGVVFCELTGKVAFGQTYEVVRIDGASRVGGEVVPGGVYALPTNTGRYARGVFAVAPEGTFKIGLRLTDTGRFYVGYNFLYLSDAVRPGDQLDRVVNPGQIAALNGGGLVGPDRPRFLANRSEFWVQGLVFGLETRY